jgi:hypothetical protein
MTSDGDGSNTNLVRLDEANNPYVDHFSKQGHLEYSTRSSLTLNQTRSCSGLDRSSVVASLQAVYYLR